MSHRACETWMTESSSQLPQGVQTRSAASGLSHAELLSSHSPDVERSLPSWMLLKRPAADDCICWALPLHPLSGSGDSRAQPSPTVDPQFEGILG